MKVVQSKCELIKQYELDFGNIRVYPYCMVGIINDGIDFRLEQISALINIAEIHYNNQKFGYISLRKNSYALDPSIYRYIKELPSLVGIAIVSEKELFKHNFKIEKYFYGNKMGLFKTIEQAYQWIEELIQK